MTNKITLGFDIGIKNLAVCAAKQANANVEIVSWRLLPLMPEERKTKPSQDKLMQALFEHLDELMEELTSNADTSLTIVIENQPSRINAVMKTVQTWTQSYFYLRKHYGEPIEGVHLVSPSQKLQHHSHEPTGAKGTVNTYKYNKSAAIALTRAYLGDTPSIWLEYFNASKKKDDLADSFLHVVAWMRRQGANVMTVLT